MGSIGMNLNEAKDYLNSKGFILEDTETNDDEYDSLTDEMEKDSTWWKNDISKSLRTKLNKRTKLYNKHANLEDKVRQSYDFNIKSLFQGVENELQKYYKNVYLEASDYDDKSKSQLVRYYFKYNKNSYMLEVMYYDEDGVVEMQFMDENEAGIERDDFSITTVDKAIKHIVGFANYHAV